MKREYEQQRPRGLQVPSDRSDYESRPRASSLSASPGEDALDAGGDLPIGPPARMLRHRSVDSVQASVEFHSSTSGRNLRLRQISQTGLGAVCSPLALTPRVPPGKRPPSGRRPRWERSSEDDEVGDNNVKEPGGGDCEGNNHDGADEMKKPSASQERRSSFSISPNALKELERLQQLDKVAAMLRIDESHEGSSGRSDDSAGLEDSEEDDEERENHHQDDDDGEELAVDDQQSAIYTQQELCNDLVNQDKPAYEFPLWSRAKRNARLPHALVNVATPSNNGDDAVDLVAEGDDGPPRRASRESESIQVAVKMVSMLHVDHTAFALAGGDSMSDVAAPLSLTKSMSPRIGSTSSSFSFETSSLPLPDHPVGLSAASEPVPMPLRAANPITKWKRGELVGAGTFGKVRPSCRAGKECPIDCFNGWRRCTWG